LGQAETIDGQEVLRDKLVPLLVAGKKFSCHVLHRLVEREPDQLCCCWRVEPRVSFQPMDAPGRVPTAINCHSCSQVVDLTGLEGFTEAECPYCHSLLVVPVEFGNFLLLHAQGVGGMGTVYRAMDMALHRYVALKVLKPGLAANPEFIESFSREARAAASVTHINVAQVYTFGEQEGHYFIAMELLEKGSLDDRIVRRRQLPEAEVLDIGVQIAAPRCQTGQHSVRCGRGAESRGLWLGPGP
jgi:hypothetical protein